MDILKSRAWAEIDLAAITHNFREFRQLADRQADGSRIRIMGVVKADAYGHGAIPVSRALMDAGANCLGVATLDEAIALRGAGLSGPILILGTTVPWRAGEVVQHGLAQTVYDEALLAALAMAADKSGKDARIHVKVETGMTRLGVPWPQAADFIRRVDRTGGIRLEGIFSHLATADERENPFAELQFDRFRQVLSALESGLRSRPIRHICNSAAAIHFPDMHLDMIRPGISLYGYLASSTVDPRKVTLKPALSFKTRIEQLHFIEPGVGISYGQHFVARRKSTIATLSVGYGDGYSRSLSGKAEVLIHGHRVPLVGNICMDHCMADVTDLAVPVSPGDEVVLIGQQGGQAITADELAAKLGTIAYEVTCMISGRVPRIYLNN